MKVTVKKVYLFLATLIVIAAGIWDIVVDIKREAFYGEGVAFVVYGVLHMYALVTGKLLIKSEEIAHE